MMAATRINFIDISVHNRHIRSIKEEEDFTSHSLGYLKFLPENIDATVVRFGNATEQTSHFKIFRYNFADTLRLYRFFNSKNEAIVLFHGFSFPFRFLFLKWFFGRKNKWIVQHHAGNPSPNFLKRKIQQWIYSKADAYMFVTKVQAEPFLDARIIDEHGKIHEIMECSTGFKRSDKMQLRNKFDIPKAKAIFIWVGNLDSNKDPMCMIQAMKSYREKHPDFLLFMFYAKTSLLPQVTDFINENGLVENIMLKGKIENPVLEDWYNAADYFISCSHSEGSGVALAESMACGCVPIVSDIPSFVYMTDGCGFLFKTGNSDDLESKLDQLHTIDLISESLKSEAAFKRLLSFEAIAERVSLLAHSLVK